MDQVLEPQAPRTPVAETRAILAERFPAAIFPKGSTKRPLKIGIHLDMIERCPDLTSKAIRSALRDYTGGYKYLRGMVAGRWRIDLEGVNAAVIIDAEEAAARKRIKKLDRKRKLRNMADENA